jgi:hypothetical protein
MEELFGHIVVAIGQQTILHREREAPIVAAHAEQHPIGARLRHLQLEGDRVGAV